MSAVVIATYQVKPKNTDKLFLLLKERRNLFLSQGYITNRPPLLLQSKIEDEFFIEIFEWKTEVASLNAYKDEKVIEIESKMEEFLVDDGFSIDKIPEASISFPHFEPLNIYDEILIH